MSAPESLVQAGTVHKNIQVHAGTWTRGTQRMFSHRVKQRMFRLPADEAARMPNVHMSMISWHNRGKVR